jgi:hypothetical protein
MQCTHVLNCQRNFLVEVTSLMNDHNNVIELSTITRPWKEIFQAFSNDVSCQVYADKRAQEIDIVLINDDGESLTASLSKEDTYVLYQQLCSVYERKKAK